MKLAIVATVLLLSGCVIKTQQVPNEIELADVAKIVNQNAEILNQTNSVIQEVIVILKQKGILPTPIPTPKAKK